jgi:hypothetical protein
VLKQWIEALPQPLEEMQLMSVCGHTSVIDDRRRA